MPAAETLRVLGARYAELCEARRVWYASPERPLVDRHGIEAEVSHVVGRAASLLPSRGEEVDWVLRALEGAHGRDLASFAFATITRRNQFPRVYLRALVRIDVAAGSARGGCGQLIQLASRWHGAVPVYDALAELAMEGALTYAQRRFFTYYVRSGTPERREDVEAAYDRLVVTTASLPDAPPGVRRVRGGSDD